MRGRERPVAPATTARRCTTLDRSPGWTERSCVRVRAYAVSLRCVSVSLPTRVRIYIYIYHRGARAALLLSRAHTCAEMYGRCSRSNPVVVALGKQRDMPVFPAHASNVDGM